VARLFGHTLFFDWPNAKRLIGWRARAQAAAEQAGYAFHGYAQVKLAGIVADLAEVITQALPADDNQGWKMRCGAISGSMASTTSACGVRAPRRRPSPFSARTIFRSASAA
jgi:hypothetical protein